VLRLPLIGWSLVAALFAVASSSPLRPRDARWPALAALLFFVPFMALAWFAGPELPTLGGAIIGGAVFALIVGRHRGTGSKETGPAAGPMVRAALPYLILLALILLTRLVAPIREALQAVEIAWSLPGGFQGRMEPLYHPGSLLFASFVIGGMLQGRTLAELASAMAAAARRLGLVALALAAMRGLSRILVHSGMIATLAGTAAASGAFWPFLSPFIGVLGTFVTGSATSSNILFSEFQDAAATARPLPGPGPQGAHNFGAASANTTPPPNITAGAATVGLAGAREGEIMRAVILLCMLYTAAGGLLTYWLAGIAGSSG
jgi:lactate permease